MIQCSKMVDFYRTEAGLTSRRGRITPAVHWYKDACTTSGNVAEKFVTHTKTQAATGQYELNSEVALAKMLQQWKWHLWSIMTTSSEFHIWCIYFTLTCCGRGMWKAGARAVSSRRGNRSSSRSGSRIESRIGSRIGEQDLEQEQELEEELELERDQERE